MTDALATLARFFVAEVEKGDPSDATPTVVVDLSRHLREFDASPSPANRMALVSSFVACALFADAAPPDLSIAAPSAERTVALLASLGLPSGPDEVRAFSETFPAAWVDVCAEYARRTSESPS